ATLDAGVVYQHALIDPGALESETSKSKRVDSIKTQSDEKIVAKDFVFACGPWLPKFFSPLLADLIYVTRQEVFFFGTSPQADSQRLPAWIDFNDLVYGLPNLDHRGFKIAIDEHGPQFDPDTG